MKTVKLNDAQYNLLVKLLEIEVEHNKRNAERNHAKADSQIGKLLDKVKE